MSSKDKNLTPVQQEYKKFAQQREPKRPVLKNCIKAFLLAVLSVLSANSSLPFISPISISLKGLQETQQ